MKLTYKGVHQGFPNRVCCNHEILQILSVKMECSVNGKLIITTTATTTTTIIIIIIII
jgi:hypothetical protein